MALKKAVAATRVGETVPIESPVRASKSNGMMEGAVKLWQEQLRTIKHFTEAKMKTRIEVNGVLFSWLIPYVTETMNKHKVGTDGKITHAVVDVGGFLGIGAHSVLLPFRELHVLRATNGVDVRVHLDTTKEKLKAMPHYTG